MPIVTNLKYSYNDLTIMPEILSDVESRKDVIPFYCTRDNRIVLPIFAAPMSSVVGINNADIFYDNNIIPIIPRNIAFDIRTKYMFKGYWVSYGLDELNLIYSKYTSFEDDWYIVADIANGHMYKMIELCAKIKSKFGDKVHIMAGNIANCEVLKHYETAGIEYVRIGIGGGSLCTTTTHTGCHVPMASLVNSCYKYKQDNNLSIKLIADGGIRDYSDVIKALALGADYVMIGGLFGSLFESAAPINFEYKEAQSTFRISQGYDKFNLVTSFNYIGVRFNIFKECYKKECEYGEDIYYIVDADAKLIPEEMKLKLISKFNIKKKLYGMASLTAQDELGAKKGQSPEGLLREVEVTGTIKKWSKEMEDYLRSIMSYCNDLDLSSFIGQKILVVNKS